MILRLQVPRSDPLATIQTHIRERGPNCRHKGKAEHDAKLSRITGLPLLTLTTTHPRIHRYPNPRTRRPWLPGAHRTERRCDLKSPRICPGCCAAGACFRVVEGRLHPIDIVHDVGLGDEQVFSSRRCRSRRIWPPSPTISVNVPSRLLRKRCCGALSLAIRMPGQPSRSNR